jgi:CCDC81-like prokaryotic HU domain 1/CCDC81-like prokaryotic HU domain 2/SPOR domain
MENQINVAHYISELLFHHDCVVLPGFGAFVSTYMPARIHPTQHTFTPPGKQIVFNKHLHQNDGLLAQTIASESACTFDEAMKAISLFAETVSSKLKAGEKAELHNIGILSLDPEGNTCFESYPEINFLIDSFGLGTFQSMPVIREQITEKRKPVERVIQPVEEALVSEKGKVIPITEERSGRRRVWVAAAILLPLILLSAFFIGNQNPNGIAGISFGKKAPSYYQPIKWISAVAKEQANAPLEADANGIARIILADNAPAVIVNIHKAIPDSTRVELPKRQGKSVYASPKNDKLYYIIAGAFSVPQNAERFRKQLDAKGYKTQQFDHLRSQLMHIALASFTTKEEAENFLITIRADIPQAWILKK